MTIQYLEIWLDYFSGKGFVEVETPVELSLSERRLIESPFSFCINLDSFSAII